MRNGIVDHFNGYVVLSLQILVSRKRRDTKRCCDLEKREPHACSPPLIDGLDPFDDKRFAQLFIKNAVI